MADLAELNRTHVLDPLRWTPLTHEALCLCGKVFPCDIRQLLNALAAAGAANTTWAATYRDLDASYRKLVDERATGKHEMFVSRDANARHWYGKWEEAEARATAAEKELKAWKRMQPSDE
jgi:hypothetical protein